MTILLTILHIFICIFLVLVVLTQQGKGQDLASAFGGAGTQAAFGARGTATLLTKVTAGTAATFMVTSLLLGYVGSDPQAGTVVDDIPAAVPDTIPAPVPDTVPPPVEPESGPAPQNPEEADEPEGGESPGTGEDPEPTSPQP